MQKLLICPHLIRAMAEVYSRAYEVERAGKVTPPKECRITAGNAMADFVEHCRRIELGEPPDPG